MAKLVYLAVLRHQLVSAGELEAFCHHDDREQSSARMAFFQNLADFLDGQRVLRNQDAIGPSREASDRGDPTRVPAHHLHHHDALMRFSRRVEPINSFGNNRHRGVKSESLVGALNVIINGLRDAYGLDAFGRQGAGYAQRILTADGDQVINFLQILDHLRLVSIVLERIGARSAENRPAPRENPGNRKEGERLHHVFDEPQPSILDAYNPIAQHVRATHHGANHGIQSGTVAAAGQDSDGPPRIS